MRYYLSHDFEKIPKTKENEEKSKKRLPHQRGKRRELMTHKL